MNGQPLNEEEHLLSPGPPWTPLGSLNPAQNTQRPGRIEDSTELSSTESPQVSRAGSEFHVEYRVYKRRWFGLVQLVLLNIIESWAVSIEQLLLVNQMNG